MNTLRIRGVPFAMHDRNSSPKPARPCRTAQCLALLILTGATSEATSTTHDSNPFPISAQARYSTPATQYLSAIGAPLLRVRDAHFIAAPIAPSPAGIPALPTNPSPNDGVAPAIARPREPTPPILPHLQSPSAPPRFIPQIAPVNLSSISPAIRDVAQPDRIKLITAEPAGAPAPAVLPPSSATYFQIEK